MNELLPFGQVEFVERLVWDLGYRRADAEKIYARLTDLDPRLRGAVVDWWEKGVWRVPEIEGFTLEGLQEHQGLAPFGALLALDWLVREPAQARSGLERPRHRLIRRRGPDA